MLRERSSRVNPVNPSEEVFTQLHIGLDDVDATVGGCTTHATYLLLKELLSKFRTDFQLIDYPNLVRLNPAVPYKTRGNGAVVIRSVVRKDIINEVIRETTEFVSKYVNSLGFRPGTEPGIAAVIGVVPESLRKLYLKALTDYVPRNYLMSLIKETTKNTEVILPYGLSRGVTGALAGIGWPEGVDCTYELLAYRKELSSCRPRCVDPESIKEMDQLFREETFLNYDYLSRRELITPHGPDPVLLGIRGEDPATLINAYSTLRVCEEVSGYAIFRTNQGTDAHHVLRDAGRIRPYQTGCIKASVASKPKNLMGGTSVIELGSGGRLYAAFFKEAGLSKVVNSLLPGDLVMVCGTCHLWEGLGRVIHAEKLVIESLINYKLMNPRCPKCGARMKSAGRGKGWKCPKCGYRAKDLEKEKVPIKRSVDVGTYLPPESSFKHLMKPLRRYGKEKKCSYVRPAEGWIK